jgi:hypothetical protein
MRDVRWPLYDAGPASPIHQQSFRYCMNQCMYVDIYICMYVCMVPHTSNRMEEEINKSYATAGSASSMRLCTAPQAGCDHRPRVDANRRGH